MIVGKCSSVCLSVVLVVVLCLPNVTPFAPRACYESVQVETVTSELDIFFSPTGVITLDHKKKLKDNTFFGNTGHFDNNSTLMAQRASKERKSTTSRLSSSFRLSRCSPRDLLHHASRFADEPFEGGFRTFLPISKKCGVRPPVRRSPARWKFPR